MIYIPVCKTYIHDIQSLERAREAVTGETRGGQGEGELLVGGGSDGSREAHDRMPSSLGVWVGFERFSGARLCRQSVRVGRDCVRCRGLFYYRQAACAWLAVFGEAPHSHPASHAPTCSRLSRARFVISDVQGAFAEKAAASTHMRFFLSSNSSFLGFRYLAYVVADSCVTIA